jgi:hypothetical protein
MTNPGGALVEAWPQMGRSNVAHQNEQNNFERAAPGK